jgi:Methyltransferase domain
MPLDGKFFRIAEPLRVPTMGTEHVSLLLYALILMLRPRSVLKIGAGYSTLFLAQAIADAAEESQQDISRLQLVKAGDGRGQILSDAARKEYIPHLHVIDHLGHPKTSAGGVPAALSQLGVNHFATVLEARFAGASGRLPATALPLDFIWFDCGAATNAGVTFLNEYWPLVNADGGLVAFHSMYVPLHSAETGRGGIRVPSALLNEIRKQLADAGRQRDFEILSLVEPHKWIQGDVTIIKKLGPLARIREPAFERDAREFGGGKGPLRRL